MRFDENGNLITGTPSLSCRGYIGQPVIPAKQVSVIRRNFNKGVHYPEVSPMYPITREQLAFIVTNY